MNPKIEKLIKLFAKLPRVGSRGGQRIALALLQDKSGRGMALSNAIVDAIENELGVYSHRFMGEDTSYPEKCAEIIKRVNGKDRSARFECCITLLNFDDEIHQFTGVIEGNIGYEIIGENGFGYDPIFIPIGYEITTAQMPDEQKHSISHRGNASRLLVEFLKEKGVK